jgi:hypothetical protein
LAKNLQLLAIHQSIQISLSTAGHFHNSKIAVCTPHIGQFIQATNKPLGFYSEQAAKSLNQDFGVQ